MVKKVSGYIRFATAKRAEVLAKFPNANFGEVGKRLGAMWRALSDAEKAKWTSRSKSASKPKSKSTKKKSSKPKKSSKKKSSTKKSSKPKKAAKKTSKPKKSSKSASPKPKRRSASPGFKAFALSKRKEKGYSKASLKTIKTAWADLSKDEKVLFTATAKIAKKAGKKSKPKKMAKK